MATSYGATEQPVPRLSLRGTARPVIVGNLVLCGFDNGKVVAVNNSDGSVQWEATVTPPHGRTELERLSDIDSSLLVSGQNVYAVGFWGASRCWRSTRSGLVGARAVELSRHEHG